MGSKAPMVSSEKTRAERRAALLKNGPVVDLGACTECGGCIEVAPAVFRFNRATGCLEVCDLDYYDPDLVDEAIKNCPEDCISWDSD